MDIRFGSRFYSTFVKAFIVLLVILVILPFIVDHIALFFNEGIAPGDNSIIVFKGLVGEQEVIRKFINILKRISFLM